LAFCLISFTTGKIFFHFTFALHRLATARSLSFHYGHYYVVTLGIDFLPNENRANIHRRQNYPFDSVVVLIAPIISLTLVSLNFKL
jgi:hypothetical protein